MNGLLLRFRNRIEPRSLGFQLLSRSIIIMAGLFILVGVFQYCTMQSFLFNKKARGIEYLIHSVPIEVWNQWREGHLGDEDHDSINTLRYNVLTITFIEESGNISELYVNPRKPLAVPRLTMQEYRTMSWGWNKGRPCSAYIQTFLPR